MDIHKARGHIGTISTTYVANAAGITVVQVVAHFFAALGWWSALRQHKRNRPLTRELATSSIDMNRITENQSATEQSR